MSEPVTHLSAQCPYDRYTAYQAWAGADKRIFLFVDRAGWHTSPKVVRPDGLRLWFLPPYSPELQPAEHLWHLSDQPLVNHCFANLDALELAQIDRCNWLQDHPDVVRSATNFHWWPQHS